MMADNVSPFKISAKQWQSLLFMGATGLALGLVGSLADRNWASVAGAAVLLGVFGAYNNILKRNTGIMSGLTAGGLIGLSIALLSFTWGSEIENIPQSAFFGLARGLVVGIVVGLFTKAPADPGDKWYTKLFLIAGSVVIGGVLGGGVGLVAGAILGLIWPLAGGPLLALFLGSVVGGYLGFYYRSRQAALIGAGSGAALALAGILLKGGLSGLILGGIAGALAPMLLVALIGAYGGLAGRGVRAMLVEAVEAPAEIIQQGAVPFLAPAIVVGSIVGAAASGADGILVLTISLALLGMMLGVLGELDGRPDNKVTIRRMVELVIIGSDDWPVGEAKNRVVGTHRKMAIVGAITGVVAGIFSAGLGVLLGQILLLRVAGG